MATNQFARLLRQERLGRGWSQQYVADELETDRVTVTRWESGDVFPSLYFRKLLCKLFEKPIEEFFPTDYLPIRDASNGGRSKREEPVTEEMAQLDAEKHYFEVQMIRLEMQRKYVESVIDITNRFIDVLDPGCDDTVRSLTIKELMTNLQSPIGEDEKEMPLPTFQNVEEALEVARQVKARTKNDQSVHHISPEIPGAQQIGTLLADEELETLHPGVATDYSQVGFVLPPSLDKQSDVVSTSPEEISLDLGLEKGFDNPPYQHVSISSNPYFAKAMIQDPEMFFGRADLLQRVYGVVAHRQCASIVGPRGIGKSSFLWYVNLPETQTQFPFDLSRHIFVFLDLRGYLRKTCEDFFHSVSKAIIDAGKKHGLTLQSDGTGENEYSSVLDQIKEQGFFPVLLLDSFDKVVLNEHFDPEFFEFLRAYASQGLVSYVTASIAPLSEICHSGVADSSFFSIFYTYPMEALWPGEARSLITMPSQQRGVTFSNEEIALVLNWAGRHPFFIQRLCYLLWEQKQNIGRIDVKQLKKEAYKELAPIFKAIWEQLSDEHKEQLYDEAQQKEDQQRKLPELSESALFRLYIRTLHQTSFFSLTTDELESALAKIGDLAALGETNLRLMKLVSLRLKNHDAPSLIDKGRAIHVILSEALQSLRGSGTQSDNAAAWKHYNILYYRYFKYHLKNEQIAARLDLSVRQYFREREKALELLYKTLLQMEVNAGASNSEL